MCGIFGIIGNDTIASSDDVRLATRQLLRLSESRGKEAAGLALSFGDSIRVLKRPFSAQELTRRPEFSSFFREGFRSLDGATSSPLSAQKVHPFALIGHSRLVTNGTEVCHENNQPVIHSGLVGIHNGIVVNDSSLWSEHNDLSKHSEVDSEVILALIRKFFRQENSLEKAVQRTFLSLQGAASIATLFSDVNVVLLATNNGSLYSAVDEHSRLVTFASEEIILKNFLKGRFGKRLFQRPTIRRIRPGEGCFIDLDSLNRVYFSLQLEFAPRDAQESVSFELFPISRRQQERSIWDIPEESLTAGREKSRTSYSSVVARDQLPSVPGSFEDHIRVTRDSVAKLRRCTRCVLPETMPFITFNSQGVCSYCTNYKQIELKGQKKLEDDAKTFRSKDGSPDCCIALSGGRDSTYGLHYAVQELGLHPIAYTYDWGMVTDLARRNISRICGKLGIEHILVSADIRWKRDNIRKNVSAWLRNPSLGMIPLFMAGDKHFYYHANRLAKETGVGKIIFCENLLETTSFKTGFTGTPPVFGAKHTISLRSFDKVRLAFYYARHFLTNTGYWNSSLIDTFAAYCSYYVIPHDYFFLFQYIEWREDAVMKVLREQYDWEVAGDTTSTWRIGDGTASFYNYIYFNVAGFTENDTFRSNQIREGQLTRDEAIKLIEVENLPRWDTIREYCALIRVDFLEAISIINKIQPIYSRG